MRVIRPFPKELLKKMFLKVLYQNGDINIFSPEFQDSCFINIICKILSEQFSVSELSEQEFNEIVKAVNELEAEELIKPHSFISSAKIKVLTKKGKDFVQSKLLAFELPIIEIEKFVTRPELIEQCLQDYLNGDYEVSVLKAFRVLEDNFAKIKRPSSGIINKNILSKSFINSSGKYVVKNDVSDTEPESLNRIVLGAMLWLKGQVNGFVYDPRASAQVLLFINIHLNIIEKNTVTI